MEPCVLVYSWKPKTWKQKLCYQKFSSKPASTSKPSTKAKSFTTSIKGIGLTTFLLLLASINLLTNFPQQLGWAVSSLVITDWEKLCLSIYSFKYNSVTKDFVGPEAISLIEVCLYRNSQDFFVNFKRVLHSCITFQAWISSVYCKLFAIGVMFTTFSIGSA